MDTLKEIVAEVLGLLGLELADRKVIMVVVGLIVVALVIWRFRSKILAKWKWVLIAVGVVGVAALIVWVSSWLLLLLVPVFGVGYLFFAGLETVQEHERLVIERGGKFHRILQPGIHFLVPWWDYIRNIVPTWEQDIELFLEQTSLDFKDGGTAILEGAKVRIKVLDPELATYEVDDYLAATRELIESILTARFGKFAVEKIIEQRSTLGPDGWLSVLRSQAPGIDRTVARWGVSLVRVTIMDFQWDDRVLAKRAAVFDAVRDVEIAKHDSKAAKWQVLQKALESGGTHGQIVDLLKKYGYSTAEARKEAMEYVKYFKAVDAGALTDIRVSGGDVSGLIAAIVAAIQAAKQATGIPP